MLRKACNVHVIKTFSYFVEIFCLDFTMSVGNKL